ncbi:MAG: thiamine diphosphokinase [Lachnospiraceae bacterium]|nr:thiamine diphosphokinase [Lachnospiraceae bacterium]
MQKKSTGILVGAAPLGSEKSFLIECLNQSECISVAADGGLSFFTQENIRPDFWLGDRDSLDENEFQKAKTLFPDLSINPCPMEKDDTDMRLGVLKLKEHDVDTILIFGGLGGERFDHSVANLQLLHEFAWEGIRMILISEKESMYILKEGQSAIYGKECSGKLSVFSMTDKTRITIRDLYYEFDGILDNKRALAVSNEFNKKGGTLKVSEGAALIIRSGIYNPEELYFS